MKCYDGESLILKEPQHKLQWLREFIIWINHVVKTNKNKNAVLPYIINIYNSLLITFLTEADILSCGTLSSTYVDENCPSSHEATHK